MGGARSVRNGDDGLAVGDLAGLSPDAVEFVRRHPKAARIAVTAALEAAAVQFGELERRSDDGPEPLLRKFMTTREPTDEMIGVSTAARRLKVSRTTVYDWIAGKRLIGWHATKRGTVLPAEQILGPGELVTGIDRVLSVIPDARAAWRFLTEESPFLEGVRRPIDALKADEIDAVVSAAHAQGDAFT